MHLFIDEAGDFAVPAIDSEHRVAVSVAVAFTDRCWESVRVAFGAFRSRLTPAELQRGEPRWHLLTPQHRDEFISFLKRDDGVSITPVTLDLGHLVHIDWLGPLLARLELQPSLMLHDKAKDQTQTLFQQARNLSVVQHLRIYCWAYCVYQSLYHAILFLGHGLDGPSWDTVSIEIDAVQRKTATREKQVFQIMLLAWMAGWTVSRPFALVEGIHTETHPFIRNYLLESGIDLGKLVRDNLSWGISAGSVGLQIADLVAGAVYAAASAPDDKDAVGLYGRLMKNSSFYGPRRGPGLFSPLSEELEFVSKKYDALSAAMRDE